MRDDFNAEVKRILASRVNNTCSNPDCQSPTSGPQLDSTKALNIGVAAHISAASVGGPRYNPLLTDEERCHANNGIHLCQNCAKLVDNDPSQFTEEVLKAWKTLAEHRARISLGKGPTVVFPSERERTRIRLLEYKGKTVMVSRESQRFTYQPSAAILLDVNEDCAVFTGGRFW